MITLLNLSLMLLMSFTHASPPTFDLMFPKATAEEGFESSLDIGHLKEEFLEYIKSFFNVDTFIESGSYKGGTTEQASQVFDCVLSIELGKNLYDEACQRFKNCPKVRLFHGDSGDILGEAIACANGRILFWLDGHYSGGETASGIDYCPLMRELSCIEKSGIIDAVIMIDDVRIFQNSKHCRDYRYPQLQEIVDKITQINPEYRSYVYADMLIAFTDKNIEPSTIIQWCTHHRLNNDPNIMPIFLGNKQGVSPQARDCLLKLHRIFGAEEGVFGYPYYTKWSMFFCR